MKHILLTAFVAVFLFPITIFAHSGDTNTDTTRTMHPGFMMMQQTEDQVLGDEIHEEMEDLMIKMMTGEITQAEADRMITLMDQNPGAGSLMMGRMMGSSMFGSQYADYSGYPDGHMEYGHGAFGGTTFIVLLWILGLLSAAALTKYILTGQKTNSTKNHE